MDQKPVSRREWITAVGRTIAGSAALGALATLWPRDASAMMSPAGAPRRIVVYKDPTCGCCKAWVPHLRANGFAPETHDRTDMDDLKDSLGVPASVRSCHTAVIGRYLMEGHVPAADIIRFVAKPPAGVVGLAVPGMPTGAPGMEMPGRRAEPYEVLAFRANGATTVFATHA